MTGRWDSEDPAGFAGQVRPDLFGYVVNDPVGGTDNAGLGPWLAVLGRRRGSTQIRETRTTQHGATGGGGRAPKQGATSSAQRGSYTSGAGRQAPLPVGVARASGAVARTGAVSIRVVRTVWKYSNRIARWKRTKTDACEAPNHAITSTSQLQSKFKHAGDFGVNGTPNKANLQAFDTAIQRHVDAADTQKIAGTYRGNPVNIYVDPKTGLAVITDRLRNFISGWKLSAAAVVARSSWWGIREVVK